MKTSSSHLTHSKLKLKVLHMRCSLLFFFESHSFKEVLCAPCRGAALAGSLLELNLRFAAHMRFCCDLLCRNSPSVNTRTKHRQFSMPHSQNFSLFRRNHAASCRYAAARPVHGALMHADTPDGMLHQPCILASDALPYFCFLT